MSIDNLHDGVTDLLRSSIGTDIQVLSVDDVGDAIASVFRPPMVLVELMGSNPTGPPTLGSRMQQRHVYEFGVYAIVRSSLRPGGRSGPDGAYQLMSQVRDALFGKQPLASASRMMAGRLMRIESLDKKQPWIGYASSWTTTYCMQEAT